MREIKFRAWHKRLKVFAPDNCSVQMQGDDPHVSFDYFDGNFDTAVWYIEDVELMQFTGLKDKDGVDIYEGDIIRYVQKSKIKTYTKEVIFKCGSFIMEEDESCDIDVGGVCSDESHEGSHVGFVIGNIYENPELMEVE